MFFKRSVCSLTVAALACACLGCTAPGRQAHIAGLVVKDAQFYFKKGQYQEAIDRLDYVLARYPDGFSTGGIQWFPGSRYAVRGACYLKLKNFAAAVRDLDRAIPLLEREQGKQKDLAKNRRQALLWRVLAHTGLRDYDRVVADMSEILKQASELPAGGRISAYARRSQAYLRLGRQTEALADLGRALAVKTEGSAAAQKRQLDLRVTRAGLYLNAKKTQLAIAECTAVLEKAPKHGKAHLVRAMAYVALNKPEFALADVEKAKALGAAVNPKALERLRKAVRDDSRDPFGIDDLDE